MVFKFDNSVESCQSLSASDSGFNRNDCVSISPSSSYAVVLKNPPKDVTAWNKYLKKVCGNDAAWIIELKPRKSLWTVIVDSKNAANSLA